MTRKMTKQMLLSLAEEKRVFVISLMGAVASGNSFSLQRLEEVGSEICRKLVAGATEMIDLLNAEGGYRPTLRADLDPDATVLADIYDFLQARRGDPRRAYRG